MRHAGVRAEDGGRLDAAPLLRAHRDELGAVAEPARVEDRGDLAHDALAAQAADPLEHLVAVHADRARRARRTAAPRAAGRSGARRAGAVSLVHARSLADDRRFAQAALLRSAAFRVRRTPVAAMSRRHVSLTLAVTLAAGLGAAACGGSEHGGRHRARPTSRSARAPSARTPAPAAARPPRAAARRPRAARRRRAAGGGATAFGDAAAGKAIFTAKCGACHTLKDAGTTGQVGPDLDQSAKAKDAAGRLRPGHEERRAADAAEPRDRRRREERGGVRVLGRRQVVQRPARARPRVGPRGLPRPRRHRRSSARAPPPPSRRRSRALQATRRALRDRDRPDADVGAALRRAVRRHARRSSATRAR